MTRLSNTVRSNSLQWLIVPLIIGAIGAGPAPDSPPPLAAPILDTAVQPSQAFDLPPLPGEVSPLLRPPEDPSYPSPLANLPSEMFRSPRDLPNGYTGRSGVEPSEVQTTPDFIPIEDRWRIGFPVWDRYDKGHKITDDYPYEPGSKYNPLSPKRLQG